MVAAVGWNWHRYFFYARSYSSSGTCRNSLAAPAGYFVDREHFRLWTANGLENSKEFYWRRVNLRKGLIWGIVGDKMTDCRAI